jgi:hypothetical protein
MTDTGQSGLGDWGAVDDGSERDRSDIVDDIARHCDEKLPEAAKGEDWPVYLDHCFRRLAYDNACGTVWYDAVDGESFVESADRAQLQWAANEAIRMWYDGPKYARILQEKSLLWRGEIEPDECEHINPEEVQ